MPIISLDSSHNRLYWIGRILRDLPESETEEFRNYLTSNLLMPIDYKSQLNEIRNLANSESPNLRCSITEKLWYVENEDAQNILEEALIDEPDEFIRKHFEKRLKELKKSVA